MNHPRILISPLEWGLGHAARCIPIVRILIEKGAEPVFAGSGQAVAFLSSEFPNVAILNLPDYSVRYPVHGSFERYFVKQLPAMWRSLREETRNVAQLVENHNIHAIISDNRYGLFHPDIPTVLITHQLQLSLGFPYRVVNGLMPALTSRFDECWVPDHFNSPGFAGSLSHPARGFKNLHYLGPISRFKPTNQSPQPSWRVLAILSGPEPHRSQLFKQLAEQLEKIEGRHIIVGVPENMMDRAVQSSIALRPTVGHTVLQELINDSTCLVGRCGYSTLMDLAYLGKRAILIPTPGQPEQEYLGKIHAENHIIRSASELDLPEDIRLLEATKKPAPFTETDDLELAVDRLLSRLN